MTDLADIVATHYDTGAMLDRIRAGLKKAGADPERPSPDDLKPVDEFHTGGIEATEALLGPLGVTAETRVLDIGSGIGGTARFIATRYGARVTGVDLTEAFVETARRLSEMCGLAEATAFHAGSAYDLPFEDESFDLATMLHVGMNLDDKAKLFREVTRVLAPGGRFALFDIMARSGEAHDFPVPWASGPEGSFVEPPEAYRDAAREAGLELAAERDRHAYASAYFTKVTRAMEENGPPPVGLQLIMGPDAPIRYGHAVRATVEGKIGPWEMVFRRA